MAHTAFQPPVWLVASLIGWSLWYRPHCGTVYCVVGCCRLSCPGQLPDRASVKSGELQAGWNSVCLIVYVCLFLWVWPPEGLLGQLVYTFMIRILPTSRTSISKFSFCCFSIALLLYGLHSSVLVHYFYFSMLLYYYCYYYRYTHAGFIKFFTYCIKETITSSIAREVRRKKSGQTCSKDSCTHGFNRTPIRDSFCTLLLGQLKNQYFYLVISIFDLDLEN